MALTIGWTEIALRLGLSFASAFLIGLNRDKRRVAAGLRTNLLVCMAAAVSMIQVNLLLSTRGKAADSFGIMDLMRLPLGILTGMGFIGGGAILKKGNLVLGVTTAASLWFTTVMGLCFGGGQIGLGLVSLAIALLILTVLKHLEERDHIRHRGHLFVASVEGGITIERIRQVVGDARGDLLSCSMAYRASDRVTSYELVVGTDRSADEVAPPEFVDRLARESSLRELRWLPDTMAENPSNPPPE